MKINGEYNSFNVPVKQILKKFALSRSATKHA